MSAGRLGFYEAVAGGTYNVYQCPEDKYAKVVINIASSDLTEKNKVVVYVSSTTPVASGVIQVETLNYNFSGFCRTAVVLSENEYVSFSCEQGGVTCSVMGIEYVTNASEISESVLTTTNTEKVLYEVPEGKVSTVNCTVTDIGDTSPTSVKAKLFVSTTTASNGSLIVSKTLNSKQSGFEYGGLILQAGQKLILSTSNISGSIATRVHGFTRSE